jgi:hypothetical protein
MADRQRAGIRLGLAEDEKSDCVFWVKDPFEKVRQALVALSMNGRFIAEKDCFDVSRDPHRELQ